MPNTSLQTLCAKQVFVIAEAGVNHNGQLDLAFELIQKASLAGANAVKFQHFHTEQLVQASTGMAPYQKASLAKQSSQFEMLKPLELTQDQHRQLLECCQQNHVLYICTPYDSQSLREIIEIGTPLLKIASTDSNNYPFIEEVARHQRNVILSTGMADAQEIALAYQHLRKHLFDEKIGLLLCTSEYPAPIAELNLRRLDTLLAQYPCTLGYSDHTPAIGASPWAVAKGARIIEKHFTLDRKLPGPDHSASIEPGELKELVAQIRQVELALGNPALTPSASELKNRPFMRKSLYLARACKQGDLVQPEDLICQRPSTGLDPAWFERLCGAKILRDLPAGIPIALQDFQIQDR